MQLLRPISSGPGWSMCFIAAFYCVLPAREGLLPFLLCLLNHSTRLLLRKATGYFYSGHPLITLV